MRRIEHVCSLHLHDRELRERLLVMIGERIPYDAHMFGLVDPVTMVASSPHAHTPMLPWPRLPELVRERYQSEKGRMDSVFGHSARSRVWGSILTEIGIADTVVVAFEDRYGAWGFLELWRKNGTFTPAEVGFLDSVSGPVTAALRVAVSRTFVESKGQLPPVGPAVVLLGPDLQVRGQTEAAGEVLLQLLPPGQPMAPIPAAAYNVGAALTAHEAGVPIEPWTRVHLGGSRWVTVRGSRLGQAIAISIEPSTSSERIDLLSRSFGLSPREGEVLSLLGIGLDSKEIAAQLFLSEHTVNDHVKALLAKTGARTRQLLVARALGS
jgi:DNA-binding CsgD family transcriptional regulator